MTDKTKKATPGKKKEGDGKFFATTKKGEIHELKSDLNSTERDKVKEAVKKVIAAMTVGKDVSVLFTDVVKSMQTADIELKKLIYLYIINYARAQPDKAILVVNTFQKDAKDPSPLVRALAIRTMGCIRVDRITEYLCEPLRQALKDKDPYVRKTAAICTAKLYDINPELVEEQDFLEQLRDMISDPNPMVVANAVAALAEISDASNKDVFLISTNTLQKLLAALNECTEWGQVFLLDALAQYEPTAKEAETIIERVIPRLQHANSAVAMSAVKVIMKYLNYIKNKDLESLVVAQKLPPPLITLLSEHKPEIQYVALRNINLIVQKRPEILAREVKHFFCKYNDPIYVKMEKLEIMIKLVANDNVDQVLLEFKEYATEVDVDFVRKAVRAIGRTAIKLERAAERCIKVLLELIQTKVNYVVQEAIIVIKDIFRKYPNKYESIIATLCENLDTLDEPEAKASMIWIIGEYAARIVNAPELLEGFVEAFSDENPQVQLQTLTATVKLFLRRPEDAKEMVTRVLNMATDSADNPDLRDRGYVYWRLLATDPEAAQAVVLADKPVIADDTYQLEVELLDTLIANISTLAAVYHKPPESFVKGGKTFSFRATDEKRGSDDEDEDDEGSGQEESGSEDGGNQDQDEEGDEEKTPVSAAPKQTAPKVVDLLGGLDDLNISMPSIDEPRHAPASRRIALPAAKGQGLQISSSFSRHNGTAQMEMLIQNQSKQPLKNFAIKFNKNPLGINPTGPIKVPNPINPGGQLETSFPIASDGTITAGLKSGVIQMAIKSDLGIAYFEDNVPAHIFFDESGQLDKNEFLGMWKSLTDETEEVSEFNSSVADADSVKDKLSEHNMFFIAKRSVQGKGDVLYMSLKLVGKPVLVELTINNGNVKGCCKSSDRVLSKATLDSVAELLQ